MSSVIQSIREKILADRLDDLRRRFQGLSGKYEIYLFGSYAQGTFSGHSDVDIVAVGDLSPEEAYREICSRLSNLETGYDVLCVTRQQWEHKASPLVREIAAYAIRLA